MRITNTADVAGVVRSSRTQLGWTQATLAERAMVSRDLINRLEGGSDRVEIAKVLDVLSALGFMITVEPRPTSGVLADVILRHTGPVSSP